MEKIRRVHLVAFLLVTAVAVSEANPVTAEPLARVGILSPFSPPEVGVEAFRKGLRGLGWIEGQNVELQFAWANGKLELLPDRAKELVAQRPDVIFAAGEQGLRAAKLATATIPIVVIVCDSLDRFIVSLAAPGGSATGLTCIHKELAGKRLGLLKEFVPTLNRVAVLYNPDDPNKGIEFGQLKDAATRLGIATRGFEVLDLDGILKAFATMDSDHFEALVVLADSFTIFHRRKLADLALEHRLPAMFGFKEFVQVGGLISYGANRSALFERGSAYVDKILKGTKAGDLPVEQPTKFELVVNLATAKAINLTIPETLLVRVDEVIE